MRVSTSISKIILPTRPQVDTVIAIYLLREYGAQHFINVQSARIEIQSTVSKEDTEEVLLSQGVLPLDIGGGNFDHHAKSHQITATQLVAGYLGIDRNLELQKLVNLAKRDDFHGKGTISKDPLDRAFGLSGLLSALNKQYPSDPSYVVNTLLPLIDAHVREEKVRSYDLPQEFNRALISGLAQEFVVGTKTKPYRAIWIESNHAGMAGFLRSRLGGQFDIVVQRLSSGHVNVITRQAQNIDLKPLVVVVRMKEAERAGRSVRYDMEYLSQPGRLDEIPEWYYDPATNSLQNGGVNPKGVQPTLMSSNKDAFMSLMRLGMSSE